MSRVRAACALVALLAMAACASGGGGGQSLRSPITSEDLVQGRYSDVMDAITRLRPGWMNRVKAVFVEGHEVEVENLRLEAIESIGSITLLRCEQAMIKYPVNCVSSTYLEILRKRR